MGKSSRKKPLEKQDIDKERDRLYIAVGSFLHAWNDVEEALSTLFRLIARMHPLYGSAAFYAVSNFDTRLRMVSSVIDARTRGPSDWAPLVKAAWDKIQNQLNRRRGFRNVIAHGKPSTLTVFSPGRDMINGFMWGPQNGDYMAQDAMHSSDRLHPQLDGYTPNEINQSSKAADQAALRINNLSHVIWRMDSPNIEDNKEWPTILIDLLKDLNVDMSKISVKTLEDFQNPLQ